MSERILYWTIAEWKADQAECVPDAKFDMGHYANGFELTSALARGEVIGSAGADLKPGQAVEWRDTPSGPRLYPLAPVSRAGDEPGSLWQRLKDWIRR